MVFCYLKTSPQGFLLAIDLLLSIRYSLAPYPGNEEKKQNLEENLIKQVSLLSMIILCYL